MPAKTVESAYFDALSSYDREVWAEQAEVPYVPRTAAQDGHRRSVHQRLADALQREPVTRFVLTGQKGSGKSTELHRLKERLDAAFEVVVVDGSEALNLDRFVDIRFVLVALAAALARRIVSLDADYAGNMGFSGSQIQSVREWVRVLAPGADVPDPTKVTLREFFSGIGSTLTGVSLNAKSDEALRKSLVEAEVSSTRGLVALLADELARLGKRAVLVIIDDLDKVSDPDSWKHLYKDHLVTLMGLPFRWVVTMPYALSYEAEISAPPDRLLVLPNVKVVEHQAPTELLPSASTFFRQVAAGLVEPGLLDGAACDRAALGSAGIPREFLRILHAAFGVAYDMGLARVGAAEVELAEAQLRRDLQRFHADPKVKRSLELVRARPGELDADQRRLMGPLLIVEYSNGEQWYDVNPLLAPEYERRLEERARRLKVSRDDPAIIADILGKAAG